VEIGACKEESVFSVQIVETYRNHMDLNTTCGQNGKNCRCLVYKETGETKILKKHTKIEAAVLLGLLASVIILACATGAYAQDKGTYPPNPRSLPSPPAASNTAIVAVIASTGGTSNPEPGTYTYTEDDTITLEATADSGFKFLYWIICGTYTPGHNEPPINFPENAASDPNWVPAFPSQATVAQDNLVTSTNPLNITCGYGYTFAYQPVFAPTTPTSTNEANDTIVVVLDALGGSINPDPGTYRYLDGSTISLTATPNNGYDFVYWVAVGEDGHPTTIDDNPTNIICGYGHTYSYQAMFAPSGATQPAAGVPVEYLAAIVVLVIVAVIAIGAALMYRGRSNK